MGRGRAKAKQTKVARELKYTSHSIDIERLREDLGIGDESTWNDEAEGRADPSGES